LAFTRGIPTPLRDKSCPHIIGNWLPGTLLYIVPPIG